MWYVKCALRIALLGWVILPICAGMWIFENDDAQKGIDFLIYGCNG